MPYVLRTPEGAIDSLHREPRDGATFLPPDHPEVQAFLDHDAAGQTFASLDADLVRVLEDLVDVLIMRNVIRVTDLPSEAQHKLFERKHYRERAQQHALNLFGHSMLGSELGPDAAPPRDEVVATDWPSGTR